MCFVDMQKAFDTINRVCLMEKLRNISVNGYMYNAVKTCMRMFPAQLE